MTAGATYQGNIGPLPNLREAISALTLLDKTCALLPDDAFEPNNTIGTVGPP